MRGASGCQAFAPHHPGYITWDKFLANRSRLAANRTNSEVLAGPAREGLCLSGATQTKHAIRRHD